MINYLIQKNGDEPAYIQLYKLVREDIISGQYPSGSKLPSKRLLAEESGVSVITAEHAYTLLSEEGYIEARERSGYFVIFRSEDGFAGTENVFQSYDPESTVLETRIPILGSSSGEEDASMKFPFTILAKTMRGILSDYGDSLFSRSPSEGTLFLRTEISRYLARSRGISVPPERIVVGSGSEYLYNQIIGLLGRNRIYGIEDPSYSIIEKTYQLSGVIYELLPLRKDGIDSASLRSTRAEVLHLTPYRSFPSGVSASASKRHEYLRWAGTSGRYLVEADYESEFSVLRKPEDTLFSRAETDNVIYLNTFSKSISPSLRVGYMLLPEHLLPRYQEKLRVLSCTVPTPIQYVLAELLRNGDFERHINRVRRAKRKELQSKRKERT